MMRWHLLLLLSPTLLKAQTRCTDSLSGASWRSTPLTVTIEGPAATERDVGRYQATMLKALAASFRDPSTPLMASATMVSVTPLEQRATLHATVALTFGRDGKVLTATIGSRSRSRVVDSALLHAVRTAGEGRGFGKVPRKYRGDTLQVTFDISDRHPDTLHPAPLGAYSTSYLVADIPPRIRTMPPARAPRGRRGRQVLLAATVNSAGRVVPGSIRLVSTNDSSLVAVSKRSLAGTTFRPGTRNGCPAESYIRQNFPFP